MTNFSAGLSFLLIVLVFFGENRNKTDIFFRHNFCLVKLLCVV